jgi:outer membrane protein assembly factor BamD
VIRRRNGKSVGRIVALSLAVLALGACGSREVPLSQVAPEDLWVRGIDEFNRGRWSEAIRHFDQFILVGGVDPRVHQARFYAAEAHFNREEYLTAAGRFSSIAADLGRADLAARARFMACRSYQELAPHPQLDQEYTRAAIDHCQALLDYFPEYERAGEAARIVEEMWSRLAAKAFEGGEWYFRRRAYDSSLIYFEDVVRLYPRTPFAPRALRRMMDVYEILDYDEELEDTRARLLRAYPESPEARALAARGGGGAGG